MTDMTRTLKLINDCDEEVHFERQVKRELLRLHDLLGKANALARIRATRIEELEAQLYTVGAGGVGPLMPAVEQPPVVEQPQIDFHDMYLKERRRAEMWIAKYEQDIGKLERAVPAAAQPQVEQEPLCWVTGYYGGKCTVAPRNLATVLPVGTALYTHPQPKREPLTVEQIDGIINVLDPIFLDTPTGFEEEFCRAIERAHGIGGEA